MRGENRAAAVFGLSALTLIVAYPWIHDRVISAAISGVIGVGTCVAIPLGQRLNGVRDRTGRRLLSGAALAFVTGLVIHPWSSTLDGARPLYGESWTLLGYLLLAGAFVHWLRMSGVMDRNAAIDGMIVAMGALAPVIQYLALPALAANESRSPVLSWVVAVYPVLDVVVVFLTANLAFSTATRLLAFRLMAAAMTCLLIGDLSYAVLAAGGHIQGSQQMDMPYLLGFSCFGTAALHPSMSRMSTIVARPVQPWSFARLALILPALGAPFLVLAEVTRGQSGQLMIVVLAGAIVVAVLARAVTAVDRLAKSQARLEYQAKHDALTGLANREALLDCVNKHVNSLSGVRPWVLYIDLDAFKMINDHWGHEIGNLLLRAVGARLREHTAPSLLVCRTGGDEFAIVGTGGPGAYESVAADVLQAIRTPFNVADVELQLTASVGVALLSDQRSADMLLRDADVAMYRAKDGGRDRVEVFELAMREQVEMRMRTELALRQAVAEDKLWVAYQPLTVIEDGTVTGAEALVRWDAPRNVSGSPADFVSVAEETGLIHEIGAIVLEKALRQLADWRSRGRVDDSFAMSVNLSVYQLTENDLPERVLRLLRALSIPPSRLILEITESGLMADPEHGLSILTTLRRAGVRLAVDDFGTGYSSLSYLSRLPITDLKIDRSFVTALDGPHSESIISSVVALAHSLSLRVTAEGVETTQQRDTLVRLGVDKGQGWLWGKAVAAQSFERDNLLSQRVRSEGVPAAGGNSKA